MKKDPEKNSGKKDNYPGRGRRPGKRGDSPIAYLIPMVLKLFSKHPKIMIVVAVIAAGFYFFGGGCNRPEGNLVSDLAQQVFSTGWAPDEQQYDATDVYEPLADNIKNPLPERTSLLAYAPKRLNQGKQGSCVAWASSYAARTILEARASGKNPNQTAFSPAYLYNQIALSNCQGSYLPEAMKSMEQNGALLFKDFGYTDDSCSDIPTTAEKQEGKKYTITGFNRLSKGADDHEVDMLAIKQHLAQGAPVVIGMMVGGSFMQHMEGHDVWYPTAMDYKQQGFGGHAMCVIGYDDYRKGGAFQIMNSWGENWGVQGITWVRYKDFDFFVREAYGIFPMGDHAEPKGNTLNATISLIQEGADRIRLSELTPGIIESADKLNVDAPFKVEITNNLPCYIYLFGEETDGSSYVLFPYTPKHSPYCGITGTRVFPRDYSLIADDIGNRDNIAVVISADPLDYNQLNEKIDQAEGNYPQKVQAIVGDFDQNVRYTVGWSIELRSRLSSGDLIGMVLSIKK